MTKASLANSYPCLEGTLYLEKRVQPLNTLSLSRNEHLFQIQPLMTLLMIIPGPLWFLLNFEGCSKTLLRRTLLTASIPAASYIWGNVSFFSFLLHS